MPFTENATDTVHGSGSRSAQLNPPAEKSPISPAGYPPSVLVSVVVSPVAHVPNCRIGFTRFASAIDSEPKLPFTVSTPCWPPAIVDVANTVIVHTDCAKIELPQLFVWLNPAVVVIDDSVTGVLDRLLTVTGCAVKPPRDKLVGENVSVVGTLATFVPVIGI